MRRRHGRIDPALDTVHSRLAERGLVSPDPAAVAIDEARQGSARYWRALDEGAPVMARIAVEPVRGPAGLVPVKLLVPKGGDIPSPALLSLHGGGFALGDLETHEGLARDLAAASGTVIGIPHYRRTPEHPFPAAWEDGPAAWRWLTAPGTCARLGLDCRRRGMVGDTAGGNLVLGVAAALRDGAGEQPAARR